MTPGHLPGCMCPSCTKLHEEHMNSLKLGEPHFSVGHARHQRGPTDPVQQDLQLDTGKKTETLASFPADGMEIQTTLPKFFNKNGKPK